MDVFNGDAWDICKWELGREILPLDQPPLLWYDEQFWNDEEKYACASTTTMYTSIDRSRDTEMRIQSPERLMTKTEHDSQSSEATVVVKTEPFCVTSTQFPTAMSTNQDPLKAAAVPSEELHPSAVTFIAVQPSNGYASLLNHKRRVLEAFQKYSVQRPRKAKTNATSRFRGVTKHRVTGKFEAHLWDATVVRKGKNRRGRHRGKQVYLGSFNDELAAARTFDMAAICYWGDAAATNFPFSDYQNDVNLLKATEKDTIVKLLRRSDGGYLPGSNHFVGLAGYHALQYDHHLTSFDDLPY